MHTPELLADNIHHLISALQVAGVRDFVISPGSRSTPVALLVAERVRHDAQLRLYVDVDERSAGFFALGLAKTKRQPVVLLSTSGTAAANYLPALVEAQIAHAPLVAVTTDRPEELQAVGAPQTIQQMGMYSHFVKDTMQVHLGDDHQDITTYIDFRVQTLLQTALQAPIEPVHINLPLRKPLMPAFNRPVPQVATLTRTASQTVDVAWADALQHQKVLVLAGPNEATVAPNLFQQVTDHHGWVLVTDVLSGQRQPDSVFGMDMLINSGSLADIPLPDIVLRFGATPVSAQVIAWLKDNALPVWQVGDTSNGLDHSRHVQRLITGETQGILQKLRQLPTLQGHNQTFKDAWLAVSTRYQQAVAQRITDKTLDEIGVIQTLDEVLPEKSAIFVANSMPIRDMDDFFSNRGQHDIYANRGANGIDGTLSTALGMSAAAPHQPHYLVTGDLTLFHDMNGLMMGRTHDIDMTVIVINNQGGGIFSFLPQAAAKEDFETLFGTPLPLDFKRVAELYEMTYTRVTTRDALAQALNHQGRQWRLIEIPTNRATNVTIHRQLKAYLQENDQKDTHN